ncbi:MAG: ParB/RepB/Spo0J family partition protein [Candidatus Omnitrophica bacterium]|nr:ParB/RepB/Spo0J family partition protein [Candidatus Omnitrophota bacterium]MBU1995815.1 ParB/RepB/Spo0J family partition protein [Candidatus Omnitrophota bacterium]MBU4334167.1 ParB/RepB/Spo0J family partition protein [Candidatus Omnitrophota bacterium]
MQNRALGKGLAALIPGKAETENIADSSSVAYIKTDLIVNSTQQPRKNYGKEELDELKASIKEKGVLQPILVRKRDAFYEVVAGERRLKAARALNLTEVPVLIKNVDDQEAFIIALVENIQREELNPIEEALAYQKMIEDFNFTQDAVARSVGKDRSTVGNILRLLKLPQEMQKSVYDGDLSAGHARTLLGEVSETERKRLYDLVLEKGLSVRELENLIKKGNKGSSRRDKKAIERNHEIISLEEDLQRALGTKVRVMAQKKRGKIIIEYYSLDDLDRLLKVLKKQEKR